MDEYTQRKQRQYPRITNADDALRHLYAQLAQNVEINGIGDLLGFGYNGNRDSYTDDDLILIIAAFPTLVKQLQDRGKREG